MKIMHPSSGLLMPQVGSRTMITRTWGFAVRECLWCTSGGKESLILCSSGGVWGDSADWGSPRCTFHLGKGVLCNPFYCAMRWPPPYHPHQVGRQSPELHCYQWGTRGVWGPKLCIRGPTKGDEPGVAEGYSHWSYARDKVTRLP